MNKSNSSLPKTWKTFLQFVQISWLPDIWRDLRTWINWIHFQWRAPTKQSLHYLLTATQKTHEIMMSHLFKQRLCAIILEQIRENKAKQPLSVLQLHTFVCLSAAIQMGPFKIKIFHSIPFGESCWTQGLVGAELLFFTQDRRLWCVYDWTFSYLGFCRRFSLCTLKLNQQCMMAEV